MSKVYTWPNCTVPDCGHSRRHGSEVRANKYAKKNQRRLTTTDSNAVCICHADAAGSPATLAGGEAPREFFTCTEALVEAATEPQEAAPEPEPQPEPPAQPLDPRDAPEPARW